MEVDLCQVDGESVVGLTAAEAMSTISGPDGSMVVLSLQTSFDAEERAVSLIRGDSWQRMQRRQMQLIMPWPNPEAYDQRSICGAGLRNGFRRLSIALIENRAWNRLVTAAIIISIFLLPLDDPFKNSPDYFSNDSKSKSDYTEWVIEKLTVGQCIVFITDVAAKILAQGFYAGNRAYLRDAFNRLDFFLAIIGVVDLFGSSLPGMNAVRVLRSLRVLRAINRFENLKTFVKLVFLTQERIQSAIVIVVFLMFVFAIISVQLFRGVLRQQCFHLRYGYVLDPARPCSLLTANCPAEFACLKNGGLISNSKISNSDNFLLALMVNVQVLTLSDWSGVMYNYMLAYHPAASLFFVVQIVLIPVYCMQIFLAIIATEIEPLQDHQIQVSECSWRTHLLSSLPACLPACLSPCLPLSLSHDRSTRPSSPTTSPSLPISLSPSLPLSLPPSLPPSLPLSLSPSLPPSLSLSL